MSKPTTKQKASAPNAITPEPSLGNLEALFSSYLLFLKSGGSFEQFQEALQESLKGQPETEPHKKQ